MLNNASDISISNEIVNININYDGTTPTVSARELYNKLGLNKAVISRWLDKNIVNNEFAIEGEDYMGFNIMLNGNEVKDYKISIDFAKKLCMMARTPQGERVRQYFLKCEEKARNISNISNLSYAELVQRTLLLTQEEIAKRDEIIKSQNDKIKGDKPKVIFATSVESSKNTILIGELAKILKQNGIDIGQNRLFQILRDEEFLGKKGEYYNMPTQKSMNLGLFEIAERTINNPDGSIRIIKTTKVTGKGQIYFINYFLNDE